MSKATDYQRFFNPEKSPMTRFKHDKEGNIIGYEYFPKNDKKLPINKHWTSMSKGTFIRSENEFFFSK